MERHQTRTAASLACAVVKIDWDVARRVAMGDPLVADDEGYVVKNALCQAGLRLRPWRSLGTRDGEVTLVGVLDGDADVGHLPWIEVRTFDVELTSGDEVECSIHVSPTVNVHDKSGGTRRTFMVDAALGASDPEKAYRDWIVDRLGRKVEDLPLPDAFVLKGDCGPVRVHARQAVRKLGGRGNDDGSRAPRRRTSVLQRSCRANVTLSVTDPEMTRRAMAFGVGPGKAFGFGTLLPVSAIARAHAIAEDLSCR